MDNGSLDGAVAHVSLGDMHALVKLGRGVVVHGSLILGVVDVLEEPVTFPRGSDDGQVWEFWLENRPRGI